MLIGLVGKAMAGKSIAASYLEHVHSFQEAAFADPLRAGLKAMLLLKDSDFEQDRKEIPVDWIGQSPRQLLQSLGTEWGRNLVHRHIWVIAMAQKLRPVLRIGNDVVISDVRFVDEAEMVHRLGGQIWRIVRPGAETTAHSDHPSEQEHARIVEDVTLINDGTQEQLFESIDDALCGWIARGGDDPAQGLSITKAEQVRMCGNSVSPPVAAALVAANIGEMRINPLQEKHS